MQKEVATSRVLISALFEFVREAVKGYPFPDPSGKWQDCRVFIHGMPEDQEDEVYPFVLIRWVEGEITSAPDSRTVLQDAVSLILGVHAPRSQAEAGLLCAELLDCLRRALWKKRIIASRFELVEPLRAAMPGLEQRLHTFHMLTLETVWNYVWPPKALEEAGQSQLAAKNSVLGSYSASVLQKYDLV